MLTNNVPDFSYFIDDPQEAKVFCRCILCKQEIYVGNSCLELEPGYSYCHIGCFNPSPDVIIAGEYD